MFFDASLLVKCWETPSLTAASNFLLPTQRRAMASWCCWSVSNTVCSWQFELWTWNVLLAKSAFYSHKMLKLMPHWKKCFLFIISFGFHLNHQITMHTLTSLCGKHKMRCLSLQCLPISKVCEVTQTLRLRPPLSFSQYPQLVMSCVFGLGSLLPKEFWYIYFYPGYWEKCLPLNHKEKRQ